nr:hypothetical protein [Acetobacter persici]
MVKNVVKNFSIEEIEYKKTGERIYQKGLLMVEWIRTINGEPVDMYIPFNYGKKKLLNNFIIRSMLTIKSILRDLDYLEHLKRN